MDAGAKQRRLTAVFEALFSEGLLGRAPDFDAIAVTEAAVPAAGLRKSGRSIEVRDNMTCGIALTRRAGIATCNARHFEPTPVSIVHPWA